MSNSPVGFWTPKEVVQPTLWQRIGTAADDFLNWSSTKSPRAYITSSDGNLHTVSIIDVPSSLDRKILKICLAPFLGIPAMAIKTLNEYKATYYKSPTPVKSKNGYSIVKINSDPEGYNPATHKARYDAILQRANITTPTPLQEHALFFCDDNGFVTINSIARGFERLGAGRIPARVKATGIFFGMLITAGSFTTSIPLSKINVTKHPSDTGVFDEQGNTKEDKLTELFSYAQAFPGEILLETEVNAARKKNAQTDMEKKVHNAFFGSLASIGEFSALYTEADRAVIDDQGNVTLGMTFERLRSLYASGYNFFELAVARREA